MSLPGLLETQPLSPVEKSRPLEETWTHVSGPAITEYLPYRQLGFVLRTTGQEDTVFSFQTVMSNEGWWLCKFLSALNNCEGNVYNAVVLEEGVRTAWQIMSVILILQAQVSSSRK